VASIPPVVRHFIVCDDVTQRGTGSVIKQDTHGVTSAIRPKPGEGFPLVHPELCVYVAFSGGSGTGKVSVAVVDADTELDVFSSPQHDYTHPADRHQLLSLVFRLRRCVFPRPGLYWVVFRHDGLDVVQTYLIVRP
jgi:hypothetical protein